MKLAKSLQTSAHQRRGGSGSDTRLICGSGTTFARLAANKLSATPMITTVLVRLHQRITTLHPRTRTIYANTALSLLSKGGSSLVSLGLVPLTVGYLTPTTYGTWATISAISTLLTFVDLGIGNGLRNKLVEALGQRDEVFAQGLVSTAYALFGLLQAGLGGLIWLLSQYVPWGRVLHSAIEPQQLRSVVVLIALAMALKLVLDLLTYVLLALQASGAVNLINLLSNGLVLAATYGLTRFPHPSLLKLALVVALCPVLVLGISSGVLYRTRLRAYRPSWRRVGFSQARQLLAVGYTFFGIQLAYLVIFYTDTLLINQWAGPLAVTSYSIALRYFTLASTLFGLMLAPYWSAFTQASVQQDRAWMQRAYRQMQGYWVGLVGVVLVMLAVAPQVYRAWVGPGITIPLGLNVALSLFVVVTGWNLVASTVVNSMGRLRLQLWYGVGSIVTNVLLALVLGKWLDLGSTGVVWATVGSLGWGAVLGPLQARKLIHRRAAGLWAR